MNEPSSTYRADEQAVRTGLTAGGAFFTVSGGQTGRPQKQKKRKQPMFTISKGSRIALTVLSFGIMVGTTGLASAETWDQAHPRRAEVNARLNNQNQRINQERREGEITRGEANKLHAEDRTIRKEERFMAGQNGGHITRAEQRALNQQENAVSRQIGR
jgi:hypothetical protein